MTKGKTKSKVAHTANKKSSGDWHVSHSSLGMGDYYGTAIRNPMGRVRDDTIGMIVPSKKLKNPPKSLA